MDPSIPAPMGVDPTIWQGMSPSQQIATSQQIAAQGPQAPPPAVLDYAQARAQPQPAPPPMGAHMGPNSPLANPPPAAPAAPAPSFLDELRRGKQANQAADQADRSAFLQRLGLGGAPAPAAPAQPPGGAAPPGPVGPILGANGQPLGGAQDDTGSLTNKLGKAAGVAAHELPLVDPASRDRMQGAYRDLQSAQVGAAGAHAAEGQGEAAIHDAMSTGSKGESDEARRAQKELDDLSAQRRAAADAHMEAASKFGDEIKNDKIDPGRMWASASTGSKIMWGVAKVLGGLAQGTLKLPTNQIADQFQHLVDQDVQAQKANFDARRGNLDSMYARAFKETGNADEAFARAKAFGMQAAAKQTESLGEAAKSPASAMHANALATDILAKSAEVPIEAEAQHQKTGKWVPAQGGGTVDILHDPRVQAQAVKAINDAAKNGVKLEPDQAIKQAAELYFPGSQAGGFANTAKGGGAPGGGKVSPRLAVRLAAMSSFDRKADEWERLAAQGGALSPADRAKADALGSSMQSNLESMGEKGQTIPNAREFTATGANVSRMREIRKSVRENQRTLNEVAGRTGAEGPEPAEEP